MVVVIFKSPSNSRYSRSIVLSVLCLVLFITFLDTTIVSVALGEIQLDLHAGVAQLQWMVNGYTLPFASLMLLAGNLADQFGRKKLLIIGLTVFATGGLISALASNPDILIAGRFVMGIGAAASEPGTLSIIRHTYSEHDQRAKAFGIWAAIAGLALALGPVIGGILLGVGSWRYIFWFNVVVALLLVITSYKILPESSDRSDFRPDFLGFIIGSISLATITFAIIMGESYGYANSLVIALFCLSFISLAIFIFLERKNQNPMLAVRYFRDPAFSGALFSGFALFFSIFAIFFFTALYLEEVLNYSGYKIATDFLPMTFMMVLSSIFTGKLITRFGSALPMTLGSLVSAIGIFLSMLALGENVPAGWLPWALALAGVGFGSTLVPTVLIALDRVPPEKSSMAASSVNTSRELGSVIGVAVLGSMVNGNLSGYLVNRLNVLKIPSIFQVLVIHAIETGNIPKNLNNEEGVYGSIVNKVINAAYAAFREGLHNALLLATLIILLSAFISYSTIRRGKR